MSRVAVTAKSCSYQKIGCTNICTRTAKTRCINDHHHHHHYCHHQYPKPPPTYEVTKNYPTIEDLFRIFRRSFAVPTPKNTPIGHRERYLARKGDESTKITKQLKQTKQQKSQNEKYSLEHLSSSCHTIQYYLRESRSTSCPMAKQPMATRPTATPH